MAGGQHNQGQPTGYPHNQQTGPGPQQSGPYAQQGGYPPPGHQQPYGQPGQPYQHYPRFPGEQHRGTILIVLAILSWAVCAVCGIVAMVMAKTDMKKIEAGQMDPAGMSLTKAAYWVSLANVIFVGFIVVLYAGFIALLIATDGFR